jgi:hypothetical protein
MTAIGSIRFYKCPTVRGCFARTKGTAKRPQIPPDRPQGAQAATSPRKTGLEFTSCRHREVGFARGCAWPSRPGWPARSRPPSRRPREPRQQPALPRAPAMSALSSAISTAPHGSTTICWAWTWCPPLRPAHSPGMRIPDTCTSTACRRPACASLARACPVSGVAWNWWRSTTWPEARCVAACRTRAPSR